MSKIFKKLTCLTLTLCMIFTLVQSLCITAQAADTSVQIISFVRRTDENLRSSELLVAEVSGYDGNISDLTFTWDNTLGTYLYVYNSSNMYNIKDTAGEVEIGGSTYIFGMNLGGGESYSGKGYAWASVYGANLVGSSLNNGKITVTVTDKDGNVIGTDSYTGFESPNLESDLEDTKYGVFKDEKINLKDMLGRSSIVHIDCKECFVGQAVTTNTDIIKIENDGSDYMVTGLKSGIAEVSLSLSKGNCKFHQNSGECTITNKVYVFEKPNTSTTHTTLTLTNIDANCDYFIGNVQGTKTSENTVVFTNLTPDTTYEVTVRGDYDDGYVYAYVTDTTKPIFRATVNFYTDNVLADTLEHYEISGNLFLKEQQSNEYISLTKAENVKGKYIADVSNGIYYIYYKNGSYTRFGDYQLTIDNENNELNIHTYSLRYDKNGGNFDGRGGVYQSGTAVYVSKTIPTREGYTFLYWTDADGTQYNPGQLLTAEISKPYILTAQWEEAVKVKVNVTINHGQDNASNDDVSFTLLKVVNGVSHPASNEYTLTYTNHEGYEYEYISSDKVSKYTATEKAFDVEEGAEYSVSCSKSGYTVTSVTSDKDTEGNIVINIVLEFDPNNFDLEFNVKMDESVPSYLYPAGVNVQVIYWGYDSLGNLDWHIIEQHKDGTVVPVYFDEQGNGSGSYPVWQLWSNSDNSQLYLDLSNGPQPYFYRIEVASYILADGTIVTNKANAFTSKVEIDNGGGRPEYPAGSDTEYAGAYYKNNAQNGTPVATISIKSYNLTFNANGGKIKGEDTLTLEKQVVIPDTLNYVPVRNGGYAFNGWYMNPECTVKAIDGSRINDNTTLYAGWKDPLSISGTITVDGFYYNNNVRTKILEVDRATNLVTTLQIKRDGTYNDYKSVNTELNYINDVATVNYNFDEIVASDDDYRIRAVLINYETTYDNDGNGFAESKYVALFNEQGNATVNAKLTFKADEFDQKYKIDATLIGKNYRPSSGLTQILFQTTGSNPPNTVISQHEVEPCGEALEFKDGIASGSVKLWKGISNGAISSYQLRLKTLDGIDYTSESPYSVRYGATTSWNTANNEAGTLTAKIVPKEYVVNFDLNAGGDAVGNMEEYASETDYFTIHTWSYNTPIKANPTRDGYEFIGWEAVEEGTFDAATQTVNGSVSKNITIRAKWSQFKWTTDIDSGYFKTEDGKKSAVVRFLFDVETTTELMSKITKTGIKFIKSGNIGDKVEDSNVAGDLNSEDGKTITTFYGDITKIPEDNIGMKYYAIAYVLCDGNIFWSSPVECGPDFNDLIIYK